MSRIGASQGPCTVAFSSPTGSTWRSLTSPGASVWASPTRSRQALGGAGNVETVLAALNAAQVRYLVVGGVAVALHGYLRTTADLDLVIDLDEANAARAIAALTGLGFGPRAPVAATDFARDNVRRAWVADKGMTVFWLWRPRMPGFEVDLFAEVPFDFDAAEIRAVRTRSRRRTPRSCPSTT